MATLSREDYRRKVYGCWLGKNIGGTLGAPYEGRKELLSLSYYDPVPTGAAANDDLDLQLVWLAALRRWGPGIDERRLGDAWRTGLQYPFDEYGIALWNLNRGIDPPVSGQFANAFGDCMGAPIRSEIWACVAPGCPGLAARYAYFDGCVDHSGEGIWGEIFFAALESAAFVCDDVDRLLDIGLGLIPPDCRTAGAVRLTRELHREGLDWIAARERLLEAYGHDNFTDAPQNIAFTVLGWLWGEDAGDGICKAVNCGYDTDCTGATLGAILGLLHGPEVFDRRWVDPVGDDIVVGWGVVDAETPATLQELTAWTEDMADRVLEHHRMPVRLGKTTDYPATQLDELAADAELAKRLEHHAWTLRQEGTLRGTPITVWVNLDGPPALAPNETRRIQVTVDGRPPGLLVCQVDSGWSSERLKCQPGDCHLLVRAPDTVQDKLRHTTRVVLGLADQMIVPLTLLPACGWRVSGPLEVPAAAAALDDPPSPALFRKVWTPDHRLELDEGLDQDRVYYVVTTLVIPEDRDVRLISATPELQIVKADEAPVIDKRAPSRFIPAAHRSGPGTASEVLRWKAGEHVVEILLAVPAGRPAVTHVFLTRPREIDGPKLVPWEDVIHKMP